MSDTPRTAAEIQWRNIHKVVNAIADFTFGSADHPQYGTSHVAIRGALTAKDGIDIIALRLEPLPTVVELERRIKELEAERDALRADAERVDWLKKLFSHHWDGTIGRPRSWSIVGHWRHVVHLMRGHSFREAIDAAREKP